MDTGLRCWKCGTALDDQPLPIARADDCRQCRADLHVCRMCSFYDPRVARACREPIADDVPDKTRANFCGYFTPSPAAYRAADSGVAAQARAQLEQLFGQAPPAEPPAPTDPARAALEALFRKDA